MNPEDEHPKPGQSAKVNRERQGVEALPPAPRQQGSVEFNSSPKPTVQQSLSQHDPLFSTSNEQPPAQSAPPAPPPPMYGVPAPPATPMIPPLYGIPAQPAVPMPPPAYGIPGQGQPVAPTAPPMYQMPTQPAPPVTPYTPVMAAPPSPALRMPATPTPA